MKLNSAVKVHVKRSYPKARKGRLVPAIVLAGLIMLCVAAFWQGLAVRHYTEAADKVASAVRLAVLADLHSTIYGDEQEELLQAIRREKPDIILLVGDIADDVVPHDGTKQLLSAIGTEYPCYYVTGNHEYWSDEIASIKEMIRSYGVTILEGDTEIVEIGGQKIRLCGVDDPEGFDRLSYMDNGLAEGWKKQFEACRAETGDSIYSVLLSHRPELTEQYWDSGFDLVVAGHSHGGQVRIPGILNGLLAPNQGWFPKYAGGRYQLGETVLIVSRGLSISRLPRIFNPPELVIVALEPAN